MNILNTKLINHKSIELSYYPVCLTITSKIGVFPTSKNEHN